MSNPKSPNQTLRYHRERHNWTQEQAAQALLEVCGPGQRGEVSAKTISKWECGVQTPGLDYREKLCRLYGVSSPEELGLLKREEVSNDGVVVPQEHLTPSMLSIPSHSSVDQQEQVWLTLGASSLGQLLNNGWSIDEILNSVKIVLQGIRGMPDAIRQKLLNDDMIAMKGSMSNSLAQHISVEERVQLSHALGSSIAEGWALFSTTRNTEILVIGQTLLHFVQQNQFLLYPHVSSLFFSGSYRLVGAALFFQGRYEEAHHTQNSAYMAALANADAWNMAQCRTWQVYGYLACGRYREAIEYVEVALRLIADQDDEADHRLRSHLLALWAENATLMHQYALAQEKLGLSEQWLADIVPNEEFDRTHWRQIAGKCALIADDYQSAIKYFENSLAQLSTNSTIHQAITSLSLASAYARAGKRDWSLSAAEKAIPSISFLNAPLITRQLSDYIQKDLKQSFPDDSRVSTFIGDIRIRFPQMPQ